MKKILNILLFIFLFSCETVPISERKQLILIPDSYINKQSANRLSTISKYNAKVISKNNSHKTKNLQTIAKNIKEAITSIFYFRKQTRILQKNINWEINLVREASK